VFGGAAPRLAGLEDYRRPGVVTRRVLLGDKDLHRILGVLARERRSLRLLEIHNGDAVAHGRQTLFHRIEFPPCMGHRAAS